METCIDLNLRFFEGLRMAGSMAKECGIIKQWPDDSGMFSFVRPPDDAAEVFDVTVSEVIGGIPVAFWNLGTKGFKVCAWERDGWIVRTAIMDAGIAEKVCGVLPEETIVFTKLNGPEIDSNYYELNENTLHVVAVARRDGEGSRMLSYQAMWSFCGKRKLNVAPFIMRVEKTALKEAWEDRADGPSLINGLKARAGVCLHIEGSNVAFRVDSEGYKRRV